MTKMPKKTKSPKTAWGSSNPELLKIIFGTGKGNLSKLSVKELSNLRDYVEKVGDLTRGAMPKVSDIDKALEKAKPTASVKPQRLAQLYFELRKRPALARASKGIKVKILRHLRNQAALPPSKEMVKIIETGKGNLDALSLDELNKIRRMATEFKGIWPSLNVTKIDKAIENKEAST